MSFLSTLLNQHYYCVNPCHNCPSNTSPGQQRKNKRNGTNKKYDTARIRKQASGLSRLGSNPSECQIFYLFRCVCSFSAALAKHWKDNYDRGLHNNVDSTKDI